MEQDFLERRPIYRGMELCPWTEDAGIRPCFIPGWWRQAFPVLGLFRCWSHLGCWGRLRQWFCIHERSCSADIIESGRLPSLGVMPMQYMCLTSPLAHLLFKKITRSCTNPKVLPREPATGAFLPNHMATCGTSAQLPFHRSISLNAG